MELLNGEALIADTGNEVAILQLGLDGSDNLLFLLAGDGGADGGKSGGAARMEGRVG